MSKASRAYKADCKCYNRVQSHAFIYTKKEQALHGFRAKLRGYEMYIKKENKGVYNEF